MSIYQTHKHHIIPRHAGGTDDPSNLVELTVEDHAIAHKVLYGLYGRWQDKIAWKALSGTIDKENIRREATIAFNKSREYSVETRAKMSASQKGKKLSKETRAKMSASKKGRKFSEETKKKISISNTGKKHSAETKSKIGAGTLGKKWYNNGIKSTLCYEHEKPEGFVKGRIKRR